MRVSTDILKLEVCRFWLIFLQKLTSWVFIDQPWECADVGHSRTIGRAAKMGWEKSLYPAIIAALAPRIRFYLHKEFRAAGIRFLSTQRIGGGDLEQNGDFLLMICNGAMLMKMAISFKENALRVFV